LLVSNNDLPSAHRDSEAVPGVDRGQGKHQRNEFLFVEVCSCALEELAGATGLEFLGVTEI